VSISQVITTAGTSGTVYACIGETKTPQATAMSGEAKLKALARAQEVLLDRIRNVAKAQLIARVEVYKDGSAATFFSDVGLSNDAFVSCGYKLSDIDMSQGTQFIKGALDSILGEMRDRVQTKQFSFLP
jgi:hypothetical protein